MLSTNVLCLKKRKKRSYHVADCTGYGSCFKEKIPMSSEHLSGCNNNNNNNNAKTTTTMLQITEDTPPDMLAGAMDLIVHLPNGNSVKMSVERSTPMMDLLVQITTNHHLQLSGYTLQPLEMASTTTGYCNDKILPFKPNTPIGVLDTQHIRVVPKIKTIPKTIQKNPSVLNNHYSNNSNNFNNNNNNINNNNNNNNNGYHQPFESTFRLKIYLPRNQLYVIRISRNVYLEDILKKVCDEKHLDPQKYEFRHPGNLDEILDPKLTLSDYQITEIHLVLKGTIGLQQHTFPTNDLMALRKEEERKQMLHHKTGGGVFNLIFRRGKTSSGSVSSENRSISPTHSDDSRSVTPPGVVSSSTTTTTTTIVSQQKGTVVEKPKAPQRKRRPAPKPPQIIESKDNTNSSDTPTTTTTKEVEMTTTTTTATKKLETGLTICHSRNSSDSSGYHEASVLSDNCGNMSLPRRPKSTTIETDDSNNNNNKNRRMIGKFSQSTSNLTKMSIQSKSTSSLGITGRKKKSAPPPPPPVVIVKQTESTNIDKQPPQQEQQQQPPSPVVASQTTTTTNIATKDPENRTMKDGDGPVVITNPNPPLRLSHNAPIPAPRNKILNTPIDNSTISSSSSSNISSTENKIELNLDRDTELKPENHNETNEAINENIIVDARNVKNSINDDDKSGGDKESIEVEENKLPEVIDGVISKHNTQTMFDSLTRKRGFQIGSSLLNDSDEINSNNNKNNNENDDDLITDDELFNGSLDKNIQNTVLNQLHGIHDYENKTKPFHKNLSVSSLRSVTSIPGFMGNTNMKKWDNIEELDDISVQSVKWVIGDDKKTDFTDAMSIQKLDEKIDNKPISVIESSCEKTEFDKNTNKEQIMVNSNNNSNINNEGNDFETDWQYELPSPPKAFRDSSPTIPLNSNDNLTIDSVVTSPELFEKLQTISDNQTDDKCSHSNFSDIDDDNNRSILNKLSLENLEKRKSLVYNRELTTSLKDQQQEGKIIIDKHTKTDNDEDHVNTLIKFEQTLDELQQKTVSSQQQQQQQRPQQKNETITKSTLPNFKITTYDNPKQKLNIFEDDTVRSNRKFGNPTQLRRNSNDSNNNNNNNGKSTNLFRTESFQQNYWSPIKPVTRSKSSVALNKYNNNNNNNNSSNNANIDDNANGNIDKFNNNDENLTKSNSLFDVSGLQSLGVMRLIQSKLNTPRNSVGENLNIDHSINNNYNDNIRNYQKQSDDKIEVQNNNSNNSSNNSNNKTEKSYQYITPSINMGTWSERPKIPVNVKEDPDYKISNNHNNSNDNNINNRRRISPVFKINNNNNNGVNVRINSEYKNVSIKVNGSEPISAENSGNVVIKIGEQQQQQQQQNRKPLGSVNTIHNKQQRPHSIAFDSDFDTSRLPVVRSVELKKPYKDLQSNNTSITQISDNKSSIYRSNEPVQQQQQQQKQQTEPKFRLNSFVQNSAPVVRGFRTNQDSNNHRFSWNHQPHSYASTSTLKNREKSSSSSSLIPPVDTISSTFQVNVRRNESTKINDFDKKIMAPPPPPPPLQPTKSPKFVKSPNNGVDAKEQLLQAIRDFGGKKGLRAVKA